MRTVEFNGVGSILPAPIRDQPVRLPLLRSPSPKGSETTGPNRVAAGCGPSGKESPRNLNFGSSEAPRRPMTTSKEGRAERAMQRPPASEPRPMNRQVLPNMLLSVLIVCVSAVALRPIERDLRQEPDPMGAAAEPPSTSEPRPPSPPDPEPEAAAPKAQPEPEADVPEAQLEPEVDAPEAQPAPQLEPALATTLDASAPLEAEAEPTLADAEPSEAPETSDGPPSSSDARADADMEPDSDPVFESLPPLDIDPETIDPLESPGSFVGPPREMAPDDPPGDVGGSPDQTPRLADEPPALPKPESSVVVDDADASGPSRSESIVIPRNDSMWGVPRGDENRRGAVRSRAPDLEASRRPETFRPAPRLWTPSR